MQSATNVTARETAVLNAVARGQSNREIGDRLGIKEQTVKNYVSVLMQKLQVRNRVQLAILVAIGERETTSSSQGNG